MKYPIKIVVNMLFVACLIFAGSIRAAPYSNYPILVLAADRNFGFFTGEILKTEGFNEFQIDSITDSKISLSYLKEFDIVILTENLLTVKQQEMIAGYVKQGGNLIA